MNKKIECPICFESFNSDKRKPMMLPCNHTFCEPCLLKCDKKICSICRNEWVSKQVNFTLLESLERYDSLMRKLGLENDEQTQQFFKLLETSKSINDLPVNEKLKKMPA
jgi:hypothetical protein